MANRSVNIEETEISTMFYIPEGVTELVYNDEQSSEDVIYTVDTDDSEMFDIGDTVLSEVPDVVPTPDIMSVVSQAIRTTATGNQVVDLVLEVEDLAGISNYDIRVTKI